MVSALCVCQWVPAAVRRQGLQRDPLYHLQVSIPLTWLSLRSLRGRPALLVVAHQSRRKRTACLHPCSRHAGQNADLLFCMCVIVYLSLYASLFIYVYIYVCVCVIGSTSLCTCHCLSFTLCGSASNYSMSGNQGAFMKFSQRSMEGSYSVLPLLRSMALDATQPHDSDVKVIFKWFK